VNCFVIRWDKVYRLFLLLLLLLLLLLFCFVGQAPGGEGGGFDLYSVAQWEGVTRCGSGNLVFSFVTLTHRDGFFPFFNKKKRTLKRRSQWSQTQMLWSGWSPLTTTTTTTSSLHPQNQTVAVTSV
jgi:hypothetical protein